MASADILRAARARITPECQWTTNSTARNAKGEPCSSRDADAVRWCAYGALVAERYSFDADQLLRDAASKLHDGMSIGRVNDRLGHKAVLAVYDAAIAAAEAEAGR